MGWVENSQEFVLGHWARGNECCLSLISRVNDHERIDAVDSRVRLTASRPNRTATSMAPSIESLIESVCECVRERETQRDRVSE